MIPEFDENGNLPPGIHPTQFDEVVHRFGGSRSPKRGSLTKELRQFFHFIKYHAIGQYIDGSYVTTKLAPSDIDIIVLLPADFDILSTNGLRLIQLLKSPRYKNLHIFHYIQVRDDHRFNGLLDDFTHTAPQDGRIPKGIIYIGTR